MASNVPKRRRALPFVLVGAAVLVLIGISVGVACGGDGDENMSRATVGFAGGTVSLEGGPEIEIPAGAIAADPARGNDISVEISKSTQKPSLPEGLKAVGDVYEIGPEGVTFTVAVRITLPIPEGEDPGDVLGVVTLDPDSGEWVMVSSAVDTEARTVSAFTTHLSPWGIVGGRSEAAKTGGWIKVVNNYTQGYWPFPRARTLPMYLENTVTFTAYNPINPLQLMRPTFNLVIAKDKTPTEYWLTAGTYTLVEGKFGSEINTDPLYSPACTWWYRPAQIIVLAPGMTFEFGDNLGFPLLPDSGYVERPGDCGFPPGPGPMATPKVTPTATPKATPTATPKATPTPTPKVTPTTTAATGQWVLKYIDIDVDKLEDPFSFPGVACSGGPKVASTETGATTTTTGTCQIGGAQVANATTKHSWSRPPERLVPGQEVSGTVTASGSGVCSWSALTTEESCNGSTSTRLIVFLADSLREESFRGADTVYNSEGRTLGVSGAGEAANAKDRPTSSFAWKVPDRRGGNKSLLVKFSVGVGSCCGNGGGSVATIFWYEWDATGGSAAATPRVITPAATPAATPTAPPEATPTAPPEATPTAPPEATPTTTPPAAEEEFFSVTSLGGANNGATKPTTFSINKSWLVTKITTYHWNNGSGATPGTIGLRASDGTTYGPWQATGEPGSGGVPNAYWMVRPNIVIPPGTYTVLDSDPSTWAQNSETGGAGMSWGSGIRQDNP